MKIFFCIRSGKSLKNVYKLNPDPFSDRKIRDLDQNGIVPKH